MGTKLALFAAALLASTSWPVTPLWAQSFDVVLAKVKLGELTLIKTSGGAKLTSTLSSTPMGVFDGTFVGTSNRATDGNATDVFEGVSASSRKSRKVTVTTASGQPLRTTILPASEETALSDPAQVKGKMMNPVQAFSTLVTATGCPARINVYDGRRTITLEPKGADKQADQLICKINYRVTAGPGHLSPLKISKARMQITYATAQGNQQIKEITLGSGMFNLLLRRQN